MESLEVEVAKWMTIARTLWRVEHPNMVNATLEESELQAAKERQSSKELEEELIIYKKETVEQDKKGFHKAIRQAGFFMKDFDLGLFDPFKDVKEGALLDHEEEVVDEGQGAVEQGDDAFV